MKNDNLIISYLLNEYIRLAYTHSYIFGYNYKGMVYAARVMDARPILPFLVRLDRASSQNGGTYAIKYKINQDNAQLINTAACEIKPICTVDYMEQAFHSSNLNRGQLFEVMVANAFDMRQSESKTAKFTVSGDVIAKDGTHYQVKYIKATYTDEKTIKNLTK